MKAKTDTGRFFDEREDINSIYFPGSSENDTSLELRNIAASLRVWGKQWERIHNIKYSLKNSDAFLNNSKERNQ